MDTTLTPITEWQDVDGVVFSEEILPRHQPAVLRGLVKHWPAVQEAKKSDEAFFAYLTAHDNGAEVDALLMRPEAKGRVFYNEDLSGFNFARNRVPVSAIVEQLSRYRQFPNPPGLAAQSALIAECLPGFLREHKMPLLDEAIAPRIWLGNQVVTPAHFDESQNIACVVAGSRRFTLFPPQQIANLYIGPLGFAPTGTPISMVDFAAPDFARYPRFQDALAAAQVAVLEPGDAIYIPTLWFHHVHSLKKVNALVNYWWKGDASQNAKNNSAFDPLLLSLLNLKHLAPEQKQAWKLIFDHYVFNNEADPAAHPAAHLPVNRRGVLGALTPELEREIRAYLIKELQRQAAEGKPQ